MVDLARWLGAQLDADAAMARATAAEYGAVWTADDAMESVRGDAGADVLDEPGAPRDFIAAHDPARVLREIDAKREIVELHHAELVEVTNADREERSGYWCFECDGEPFPCRTLRLHALPYADRPGYAEAVASVD